MLIKYYIRQVYGKDTIYVVDPFIAGTLQGLTGKKTLDQYDITALENLGHKTEQILQPRE